MLTVTILAGVVGWIILGVIVVAIAVALELTEVVDTDKDGDAAWALVLWPLAIVISVAILLGRFAMWLGELLRP